MYLQNDVIKITMLITVVTLFPSAFPGTLAYSIPGRQLGKLWNLKIINIRDFSDNKWQRVDDTPYGGGAGMLIKPNIIHNALNSALNNYPNEAPTVIYMTPRGKLFNNVTARRLAKSKGIIILCGRYEGIDQRVIDHWELHHNMEEISIGDYVLFGGEVAATVVMESVLRFIPGMMHNHNSAENESFEIKEHGEGQFDLLEYPQYTKPAIWHDYSVPSVLLSGNHFEIAKWQIDQSKQTTRRVRPDLWNKYICRKRYGR